MWFDRVLLDSEVYAETVVPLPTDPEVAEALSAFVVAEVLREASALPGLEEFLEGRLGGAVGRAAGGPQPSVEQRAADIVDGSIQSEAFAGFWREANLRVHPVAIAAITGDGNPALERQDGRVELDLKPAIDFVAEDLSEELEFSIPVPEGVGRIELFHEDDVGSAHVAARLVESGSWIIPVLNISLFALALVLARRRLRAAVVIGIGVALASIGSLFLLREGRAHAEARGAESDLSGPAAGAAWDTVTRGLADQSWILLAAGLGIAMLAMLGARAIVRARP